ncbi:MAG TPA: hypothetical protein VJH88_02490 [Candidatus Nanoarchaeia archaeon]|nr:hypothetical protein [Candidatus Nanoarchaeia archaeon]
MKNIVIKEHSIKEFLLFVLLFCILLALGIYSQWPTTITPDAAMHAEIVELIRAQGVVTTWQPYAVNQYTYPPLFHYIAFLLPLEPIDAVRALGLVLWLLLPVAMYLLLSTFDRRAAVIGAILIGLVPSFSNVFIYSEFPQLMSMVLLLLEWYFLRKEKHAAAAVAVGVIGLTHVFFVLVAAALFLAHVWLGGKVRALRYLGLSAVVMIPWLYAYGQIVMNVLAGTWENTRYNLTQPVFGFWSSNALYDWFVSAHGLTLVLMVLASYGLLTVKDRVLRGLFVVCVVLSVYHIPFTQLKMFDLLAVPAVMLAAIGLSAISLKSFWKKSVVVIVVIFMLMLQVNHFWVAKNWWLNPEIAPTEEFTDAARWLRSYDDTFTRVFFYQASAWGGVLSGKLPLDPDITHLEAFSDDYKEQVEGQRKIKEALVDGEGIDADIVERYDIKYFVLPVEFAGELKSDLLYSNDVWGVYRIYKKE